MQDADQSRESARKLPAKNSSRRTGQSNLIPLTAFEELLFWTDQQAYPCSIFSRFHFDGVLDRDAVNEALHTALRRHVLFCSVVVEKERQLCWSPVETPCVAIQWQSGETGGAMPPGHHLDLRNEIGMRAWVVQDTASADITLQIHHACADGAGIVAFLNDFFMSYAILRGENSPHVRLPDLDTSRLARRGEFGMTKWKLFKLLPKQLVGLIGAVQFFYRRPVPILPSHTVSRDQSVPDSFPSHVTLEFSKEVASQLRAAARNQCVTLNDLLARELFLAVNEWRVENGVNEPDDWLRMMVPMDLRSKSDMTMPAANVVSSAFLDRRGRDCRDPLALLQSVHGEMQLIKRLQLGLTFIFSLHCSRLIGGGLKRLARQDRCSVSFVFTNLGSLFRRSPLPKVDGYLRMGDVIFRQLEAAVPVGPNNAAVFAVHHYARRLTFTLNYDPRVISEERANELMHILSRRLHASLGQGNVDASQTQPRRTAA